MAGLGLTTSLAPAMRWGIFLHVTDPRRQTFRNAHLACGESPPRSRRKSQSNLRVTKITGSSPA
jgi:hypothetical protein